MATLSACVGSFQPRSGTGTQTVSGITDTHGAAFTPATVIFWGNGFGAGFSSLCRVVTGFDDGTLAESACVDSHWMFGASENAGGFSRQYSLTAVEEFLSSSTRRQAKITAFGVGSFTLTYALNESDIDGDTVNYIALGAEIPTKVGYFPPATNTDPQAITGVGFEPTAVVLFHMAEAGVDGDFGGWGEQPSIGFFAGASQQVGATGDAYQAQVTSQTWSNQQSSVWGVALTPTLGAIKGKVAGVSLDADGFTVQATGPALTSGNWAYLAFGNVTAQAGTFTVPLTSGAVAIAPAIGTAQLLLLLSNNKVANPLVTTGFGMVLGAADGLRQATAWCGAAAGATDAARGIAGLTTTSAAFVLATPGSATPAASVLNAVGAVTSFSPIQLSFSTVGGVAYQGLYLALGDAAPPPPPTIFGCVVSGFGTPSTTSGSACTQTFPLA